MEYTSKILIENYLKRELTEDEEAYLTVLLPAIRRWIDNKTGSHFAKVNPSTRYFDGGGLSVDIDPCTAVESINSINSDGVIDYTYTTPTEYLLEPRNENVKRELRRRNSYWSTGVQNIAVTACFSEYDDGVPEDIQTVATALAAGMISTAQIDSDGSVVESESIEGHTIKYAAASTQQLDELAFKNPLVQSILAQRTEVLLG